MTKPKQKQKMRKRLKYKKIIKETAYLYCFNFLENGKEITEEYINKFREIVKKWNTKGVFKYEF